MTRKINTLDIKDLAEKHRLLRHFTLTSDVCTCSLTLLTSVVSLKSVLEKGGPNEA